MPGLFADARRTALGAVMLLIGVILFTDRSGTGGSAVAEAGSMGKAHAGENGVAPPAGVMPLATAAPPARPESWFAENDGQDDDPPPPSEGQARPPGDAKPANPGEIRPPPPTGPDFPPGLTR